MAQGTFKIDLKDSQFPLMSSMQGRSVIVGNKGETPEPPSIAYCHNVMPTKHGYRSISYVEEVAAHTFNYSMDVIRVVYGDERTRLYLAFGNDRRAYLLDPAVGTWVTLPLTVPTIAVTPGLLNSSHITVGTVNGVSYIYFYKTHCFIMDKSVPELAPRGLVGITEANIVGVVASSGYLIAYTEYDVTWSSLVDPTDFVPSQVTGAGGGSVEEIAGEILFCVPTNLGFLIYTKANVVAATYTGNKRYPFKFREVSGSSGGRQLSMTTHDASDDDQFVYSRAGLQVINSRQAENILPEVTDFLDGSIYEELTYGAADAYVYNYTPNTALQLHKQVTYIGSRYLVLSYGFLSYSQTLSYSFALVYDTALERMGKLKIEHVACFEYLEGQGNMARHQIAFLQEEGEVQLVDMAQTTEGDGILVLGKLQHSRNRLMTLQEVELEGYRLSTSGNLANLVINDQVSLDGVSFTAQLLDESYASDTANSARNVGKYHCRHTGKNHSIVFWGDFDLTTALIRYSIAGSR